MKNSQYFPHDYLALDDTKIQDMLFDIGCVGYGIFWALIEVLYQERGRYPLSSVKYVAYKAHADLETTIKVIHNYGLFGYDDTYFWSESQLRRQKTRDEISESKRKGGRARAEKTKQMQSNNQANADNNDNICLTNAQQMLNDDSANAEKMPAIKENKIKEKKNKDNEDKSSSAEIGNSMLFPDMVIKAEKSIDPREVFDLWNTIVEETGAKFPKLKVLTESKRTHINARLQDFTKYGEPLDIAEQIIRKACASEFLNNSSWANFKWIFCYKDNWDKIYEGDYDNRTTTPATGYDRLHIPTRRPEEFEGDF